MGELVSALGSTPTGILILGMFVAFLMGAWYLSKYITLFSSHAEQDRVEFIRLEKAIKDSDGKRSEQVGKLYDELHKIHETVIEKLK